MGENGVTIIDGANENLYAGSFPRVEMPVTIVLGAGVLARGTVLGKITATGKYDAYDNADNTGLEVAKCILAENIDATAAAVKTSAYFSGEFNEAALTGIDAAGKVDFEGTPVFVKAIG